MDAYHGAGAADDAGAGLLLRRHGAIEERAQHDDDELLALGPVAVAWALLGYSLAFAPGSPLVGSFAFAGLWDVGLAAQGAIPHLLFMAFQGTFAIITAALISGAVVERMRFGPYLIFIVSWVLGVYAPVAHWVWGGGFLATAGALDLPAAPSCTSTRRRRR